NSTGAVGYINSEIKSVFASFLVRLKPNDGRLSTHYLFLLTTSPEYQDYIDRAGTGSARKGANARIMTNYPIALSPQHLMEEFHEKVDGLFQLIEKNIMQNKQLSETRDYLLPRLLSGE